MEDTVQVKTALLRAHPMHSFYHTGVTEQPELYDFVTLDIREHGIRTPLLVQAETYAILDGHMRHQIALDLQMEYVPVIYQTVDEKMAELALVNENRKRQANERDPIRVARQIALLKKMYGLKNGQHGKQGEQVTMDELARGLGLKPKQLYKYLRLIRLTSDFQRLVSTGLLGIKSAVSISYLSHADQQVLFQLAMQSGSPKNALAEALVTVWITQYRASRASSSGTGTMYVEDIGLMNAVDQALDAIDRDYEPDEVVGTDRLRRQAIVTMAESLSAESGAQFETAVADKFASAHIRALQRMEQRMMAIIVPGAILSPEVTATLNGMLRRLEAKLQTVEELLSKDRDVS